MAYIANDYKFGTQSTYVYGVDSYDYTKFGLGSKIFQRSGYNSTDNYVAPAPIGFARPIETGGAVPAAIPQVVNYSSTINWVFFTDQATAAATRRIQLYTHNKITGEFIWIGFITLAYPYGGTQGVYTITGFQPVYDKYVTGTASCSGSTVTGIGTAWQASGFCAGNRIGFGTTDPSAVTRWYEIATVNNDTSITLTETASIISGTYVIEDLRMITCVTNGTTTTNGGLFVAKGLRFELFNGGGPTIVAATSTDNLRANYWLADASTVTNIASIGCDIIKTDLFTQHVYVLDTVANPYIFKYNIRASLTGLASGKSTAAFIFKSGQMGALTGAPVQTNNFCIASTYHGAGAGKQCGYFTTATRFYRTVDVTTITSGNIAWAGGNCPEVPPGGTLTYAATGALKQPAYIPTIDRFVIMTSGKAYLTRFKDDGSQWDRIFLDGTTQTLQINADNVNTTPWPSNAVGAPYYTGTQTVDSTGGTLYMAGTGVTNITNYIYSVPIGADWESTDAISPWAGSKQVMITPQITTPNVSSYVRAYVNVVDILGGYTLATKNLGTVTEPIKVSYRTTGITDDSGVWYPMTPDFDLTSVNPSSSIQFRIEWKVAGNTCIPSRVTALGVIYQDLSTDSHYQPSVGQSSIANKQFAWRFSTAFGTVVPRLKISLYDAVAGTLLLVDDSTTQAGTWERSTDGGSSYATWNNTDKGNETTYLRFTPISLGDNLRVRALLTQY
jgi:hypothetical protein